MNAQDNSDTVYDDIETLILMLLDAKCGKINKDVVIRSKNVRKISLGDTGEIIKIDDMAPYSSYTADMYDADRIITTSPKYLAAHPYEILGEQKEVALFGGGLLKWRGFRRMRTPPKGVACVGKASHWYEMHTRYVNTKGQDQYFRRIVPISKTGETLMSVYGGKPLCNPINEGECLIMCCSVIEDAHRANTMLAAIKSDNEIKLPVPLGDYKELFSGRDGPFIGNRKKAIVHWVAGHTRKTRNGEFSSVKKHTRGIQKFTMDGINVTITPNRAI